jgi:phosphoglycerate kinase
MENKLSLKELDLKGKKVLMRVDFNVPLKEGKITDDTRIAAALPSISYILKQGGSLILMSHLGRPDGQKYEKYSLAPCAKRLSEMLQREVIMAPDCIGPEVQALVKRLQPGQLVLLENLRFYPGEEKPEKDPSFAKQLAELGDLYVNDAFGTAHRVHASTVTIAQYFPGKAAAGFLMEKEIEALGPALLKPERPFYAIIGGAKISSKLGVLKSLVAKVDGLFIGGGMAYTFMKAQGLPIGNSIHEDDYLQAAKELIELCAQKKIKLFLPIDIVVADRYSNEAKTQLVMLEKGIPEGFEGVDIGPKTIAAFSQELKDGKTVFWNGPLGVFEFPNFAKGTVAIAQVLANLSGAKTIIGGGDSVAAINQAGLEEKMTHISTGGGASMEYIEFGTLPGIDALTQA